MGGEPWCFSPDIIARMTDFQIHHGYVLPAVRRAERESGDRASAAIADAVETGGRPNKAAVVSLYMSHGMSQEAANRMAEAQWKEWDSAPADAWWRNPGG